MSEALSQNVFLVKEHVGMFKAANNYDVLDVNSGNILMECREPSLGIFTKILRFTDYKRMTPFEIVVKDSHGSTILRVKRGISIFLSKVDVYDDKNHRIGGFKQKLLSIGGAFTVLDQQDNPLCELKGKWTSWDFRFMKGQQQLAQITKKWSGIGKELFTSADNYVLQIDESLSADSIEKKLILAAVLCIDMVLKE